MKLIQINTIASAFSTGRIAEHIGKLMQSRGWESYLAYGRFANASSNRLIKIGNRFDEALHLLESRLFDCHGLSSKRATKRLIEKIKQIDPDVIHLHNIHGYYLNYPILFDYLSQSGKPVVWTLHDCWAFTGHCSHFATANCYRWKSGCFACPLKGIYPRSIGLDRSRENYANKRYYFNNVKNLTIVTVSQWLKQLVQQSMLRYDNLICIPNGIDLNCFRPIDHIDPKYDFAGKKVLLGVGTKWTREKGYDDFVELAKHIDDDYRIVLLGLNVNRVNRLPDKIIAVHRTENMDVLVQLYNRALVLLTLSHNDTYPTTNLESLACGTPVITYPTGGSPEAIDETTGYVVEPDNFDALIEAIRTIDKNGKAHYSAHCRARAEKLFDKDLQFAKYGELYMQLTDPAHNAAENNIDKS